MIFMIYFSMQDDQSETSGDADVILWDNSYIYATDPNKNVRVKRFPNDWIPGTWVEEFIDYKPFGELKNYVADPPRFMFSSEEYMPETGMYHYLYRAYSPSLARFITRDPIEEQGGVNLYCFVGNNPVSKWDRWGLIGYNQALRQEWNRQLSEIPWYERIRVRLFEKQWRAALSPEAKFYIWYEADKAEGTAWMDNLPNCPDCIKIGSDGKPENCTNGQWSEIQELEENNFYHPGAKWAMRSNELWGFESGVQQQCTYDKHGYLIKSGMAAGTPDKGTGNVWGYTKHYGKVLFIDHNGGSSEHEDQDVIPFEEALELDGGEEGFYVKKYLELRPPNQGGGSCYD